jgi:hypothetical protein
MELFRLVGNILIDDKDAIGALKRTEDRTKATQASFKKFGESAVKVGKTVAIGLGVAATAATALVKKFADTAGEIDDAAKRVGMSAEEYQKWTYAAKLAGLEAEKLEAVMKRQQTSFSDAVGGSKKLQLAYKRLGINIEDVGDSAEAFELVIEALAEMEDETLRNEIANDLFGKSYADLIPLFEEGAEKIRDLREEAEELGGVISNENVEAGAKFGDTMDRLNTIFAGIANEIATALLPYFQKFADWVVENRDEIQKFAKGALESLASVLTKVGDFLGSIIDQDGDATTAFENIVWFLGAITAAPLIAALAAHPILAIVGAIGAMIAFKDQIQDVYNALNPGAKLVANLTSLGLVIAGIVVAATGGFGAIAIGAGLAAVGIAFQALIGDAEMKARGMVDTGKVNLGAEMSTPRAYVGTSTRGFPVASTGSAGSANIADEIARAVKAELKGVSVQLDGKKVGKFVDNRLLTATE